MSLLVTNLDGGQTDAALSLQHFGSLLTNSGVLTPTSFTVSAQVSPDMTIKVSGSDNDDKAAIITDSGDTYFIKSTQDENVTITANASGVTKTDAIVLYVDLTDGDPDNAGSPGAAKLIAVRRSGTSTGAPTTGEIDAATNNNPWLKLDEVVVTNGATEITSGNLTDVRIAAWLGLPLNDGSVTTAKISDAAVTPAKRSGGSKVGVIAAATFATTGNKAITGVGFRPKLVRFTILPTASASSGSAANGAMDENGNQFFVASTGNSRNFSTTRALGRIAGGSTAFVVAAEYVSMDADGFTVNVTTADAAGFDWAYEAYG